MNYLFRISHLLPHLEILPRVNDIRERVFMNEFKYDAQCELNLKK